MMTFGFYAIIFDSLSSGKIICHERSDLSNSFSMSDSFQSVMGISKLTRHFIAILLIINFIFIGIAAIPESFSQDITDDEIKAALVFKFPVYVRWPGGAMNAKIDHFEFCVMGNCRLSDLLSQFDGEKVMGKTIRIKRLSNIEALGNCHMLFISSSEKNNLPAIFKAIKGKPVLTVGDMKGFALNGGVINFTRKKDSVHFEINPKAGKRAGLKISSKLLRLAKIVGD